MRFLRWLGRMLGQMVQHISRRIGRMCFGTWRRGIVSSGIAALIAAKYYPAEVWPVVTPLLQIAVTLFGIRVMLHPYWPMGKKKKRR